MINYYAMFLLKFLFLSIHFKAFLYNKKRRREVGMNRKSDKALRLLEAAFFVGLFAMTFSVLTIKPKSNKNNQRQTLVDVSGLETYKDSVMELTTYSASLKKKTKKIKIVVIDTGIDYSHPLLKNYMPAKVDPIQSNVTSPHGTHVAGIIASNLNKVYGKKAWELFEIESVWFDEDNNNLVQALKIAIDKKPAIINVSISGKGFNDAEEALFKKAKKAGIKIVVAAGNNSTDEKRFPCGYESALCVANLDGYELYYSSNYGDHVKIEAQGTRILSAYPKQGKMNYATGTSMAAPLVTAYFASAMVNKKSVKYFDQLVVFKDSKKASRNISSEK